MADQNEYKHQLFAILAQMSKGLASDKRLEILDLLTQAPKTVETLTSETGMSVANTSRHLQILKQSHFVTTQRDGNHIIYHLASQRIHRLVHLLVNIGENEVIEFQAIQKMADSDQDIQTISLENAKKQQKNSLLLDVRPSDEFEHGHVDGAVNIPFEDLSGALEQLPKDKAIIVYCRGKLCSITNQATQKLNQEGFDAYSLHSTWQEWSKK